MPTLESLCAVCTSEQLSEMISMMKPEDGRWPSPYEGCWYDVRCGSGEVGFIHSATITGFRSTILFPHLQASEWGQVHVEISELDPRPVTNNPGTAWSRLHEVWFSKTRQDLPNWGRSHLRKHGQLGNACCVDGCPR
jgi:hypothetical protein